MGYKNIENDSSSIQEGYVWFNPKTIRYLYIYKSNWGGTLSNFREVDAIKDASLVATSDYRNLYTTIVEYIEKNKLIALPVRITKTTEILDDN